MGWFSAKKVRVTFLEEGTNTIIAETQVGPDQLPETFALSTTFELRGQPYEVVRATPLTRAEFTRSGLLTLLVRQVGPVTMVKPSELLYSLSTINDELPPSDSSPASSSDLVMTEDDWRQAECISASLMPQIQQELDLVRDVHRHARVGLGFSRIHVRSIIARPLEGVGLTPDGLQSIVDGAPLVNVRFQNYPSVIKGGVAFSLCGQRAYGVVLNGDLTVLGLCQPPTDLSDIRDRLLKPRKLVLVHWPSATILFE